MLELVAELERSLLSPERFARALRRWAGEDPRRGPYARDVGELYLAYARELERLGRVDGELFAWRALDALRATPGRWGSEPVFFYGFDDLHPLERDAVETLARVVGVEVMVSLTYEPGRDALKARAEVVEELRPLAEGVLELPALDEYYSPGSRAALHHLERSLFEPAPDERVDPGVAVRLLEAAGERAEAELVAAEVLELLRRGLRPEEIAVVCRSVASSGALFARALERFGVPAALPPRVRFSHTALGRALLGLARCALLPADEAAPQDLLDYLRAPGLLERLEVADALDLNARCEGLTTAAQARERLSFEVDEIDALRAASDPGGGLVRHGRRLLAAPHRGAGALLDTAEQLDARALAALVRALDELHELRERLNGRELIELLERIEVSGRSRAEGAVLVAEPLAIRARRFRAVVVCGLGEGEFPRATTPEPFLSDDARHELAACGLRLRPREDSLERERYLFYSAVSRATETVLLSYRSADEEGNLELPSPFISDVAELMVPEWRGRRRRRMLADVVWPADAAPTPRELARTRAAAAAPVGGEPPGPPRMLSAAALGHVRHMDVLSAGALEAYADCPVKWLVERELRPRRFEPEPDPIARGSYMHDVLEQVLQRLGRAVTPESLPEALELLDSVITEVPPEIAPGRPERLRRAQVEAIAADLRRYLEHESVTGCGWEPRGLELRFGFVEETPSLPALELGQGSDRVAVRGAIDRVDVEPSGARAVVRDYKSGGSRPEHQGGRWSTDRRLQVALYMLAVRDLLGLEPVAGLYQPLSGRDLRARGVFLEDAPVGAELVATDGRDAEGLAAELEDARARAVALAARLRSGEVTPCPETCSRDGCSYPGICRAT
jgi:RecB family exonuclease